MHDLAQWLSSLGMAEYSQVFAENDIDLSVLDELTEADLKELGMSLGQRKRLIKARREYQVGSETEVSNDDELPPVKDAAWSAEKRFLTLMFCDLA
ncbi:MAG: SAM domain-containing protein, partial [Gammaproteobacteria bacterium]